MWNSRSVVDELWKPSEDLKVLGMNIVIQISLICLVAVGGIEVGYQDTARLSY